MSGITVNALKRDTPTPDLAVSGTSSASGDTTIIAAPGADVRIVVKAFQMQNESATATTMKLCNNNADIWRVLGQAQGDGVAFSNMHYRCQPNTPLVLNLSGANACGYSVIYYLERS